MSKKRICIWWGGEQDGQKGTTLGLGNVPKEGILALTIGFVTPADDGR
jgi:hypothetical protein